MPTRFNSIGLTGRTGTTTNTADAYKEIIEVDLPIVASAAAQTTTITLPTNCVVNACNVYVKTAEATGLTKTVSVGIDGGSGTAYANAVSVAATGLIAGATGVAANGVTISYTLGSNDFAELDAVAILEITAINV